MPSAAGAAREPFELAPPPPSLDGPVVSDGGDTDIFPFGLPVRAVRGSRGDAVELAIAQLEAAPRNHGSGYLAEALMRALSRAGLTPEQRARRRTVVVAETTHPQTRGLGYVGALAGAVWDDVLEGDLVDLRTRGSPVSWRAARVVEAALRWRMSPGDGRSDRARTRRRTASGRAGAQTSIRPWSGPGPMSVVECMFQPWQRSPSLRSPQRAIRSGCWR